MAAAVAAFGEVEEDAVSKLSGPEEKKPAESDVEDTRAESTNWGKGSEVPRAPRPGKSMWTLGFNLRLLMQKVQHLSGVVRSM